MRSRHLGSDDDDPVIARYKSQVRTFDEHFQTIRLLLDADVAGALRYLNGLTPYRFSGLYVFESGDARNWYLVDRDSVEPDAALLRIPMANTYCAFVRDTRNQFKVADALEDERLVEHPSRSAVRAYCGAPLLDGFGKAVGSICHFDFKPVKPALDSMGNDELLDAVAPMFAARLANRLS